MSKSPCKQINCKHYHTKRGCFCCEINPQSRVYKLKKQVDLLTRLLQEKQRTTENNLLGGDCFQAFFDNITEVDE